MLATLTDNTRRTLALTLTIALGAGIAACDPEAADRDPRVVTERTAELGEVVDGNNAFAVDVYDWMAAADDGNLFFSPFSITSALAMTYAGAAGDTATDMETVLHITLPSGQFHKELGDLTRDLDGERDRGYELSIANRLFGQTGYTFGQDFLDINADDYGAPLDELDYAADPEAAREHINTWVAGQTHDMIEELLAPGVITEDTRLVLANAIYFNATWASQFELEDTYDQGFVLADGGQVTVPMMHQHTEIDCAFFHEDGVSVASLPYTDDELSMVLIVPDDVDGLPDVEAQLDAGTLEAWIAGTTPQEVDLAMPRFELEHKLSLKDTLTDLGMGSAFESTADFTGITDTGIYIADVIHEAVVRVDEEGTEAAAATAVVMEDTAVMDDRILADHPFLFLIRDDLTGTVLFMGRVTDPS